jgi:hypothetical protein
MPLIYVLYGFVANLQKIASVIYVAVEFPQYVITIISKFSFANLHFLPPWKTFVNSQ